MISKWRYRPAADSRNLEEWKLQRPSTGLRPQKPSGTWPRPRGIAGAGNLNVIGSSHLNPNLAQSEFLNQSFGTSSRLSALDPNFAQSEFLNQIIGTSTRLSNLDANFTQSGFLNQTFGTSRQIPTNLNLEHTANVFAPKVLVPSERDRKEVKVPKRGDKGPKNLSAWERFVTKGICMGCGGDWRYNGGLKVDLDNSEYTGYRYYFKRPGFRIKSRSCEDARFLHINFVLLAEVRHFEKVSALF